MKEFNKTGLRGALEEMPAEELRAMLQAELGREEPDPDSVRLILNVLEDRESEKFQNPTPENNAAWELYQQRMKGLRKNQAGKWPWAIRAASLILVIGLLFAIVPQKAEAETFWEMLHRMSDTVIEFFSREDRFRTQEYVFRTNNPGLQKVYDAVVELGITEPVVPSWLPDNPELVELKTKISPMNSSVCATFLNCEDQIVYKLTVYEGEPAHQYFRDEAYFDSYERNGADYNITRNNDRWSVIWTKDNIECHITLDCQEETLRRILKSIYVMEE